MRPPHIFTKLPGQTQPGQNLTQSLQDGLRLPAMPGLAPRPPPPAQPRPPGATLPPTADAGWLYERALTCIAIGAVVVAIESLRAALRIDAGLADGWRHLQTLLEQTGDAAGALEAAQALATARGAPLPRPKQPALAMLTQAEQQLAAAIAAGTPPRPRLFLRERLLADPLNAPALRLMARAVLEAHDQDRAERLLERALDIAPHYIGAREDYAEMLSRRAKWVEALQQAEILLKQSPGRAIYQIFQARTLIDLGDTAAGIAIYENLLRRGGASDARLYLNYANALREAGRRQDCAQAYRRCLALDPAMGEAYFGLANLKHEKLTANDISAMRSLLARPDLDLTARYHLHYALGHALEKIGDYQDSFTHYAAGAAVRRNNLELDETPYDPEGLTQFCARMREYFTPALFAARRGSGSLNPAPIFIVGMPRSGSTLVEQILASHSAIEGLQELPELTHIMQRLDTLGGAVKSSAYPDCLDDLDHAGLAALGEEYISRCARYRKTGQAFFIDKMPGNWANIGLIQLILPNAKIIDARRHPMAACLGTFKQLMIGGATFSYSLTDIGRRYRDYVQTTAYFDQILPGRVHLVQYEAMVADPEAQIRALLAYCGVAFEPQCLRFWETERTVRTPSAEQVRRPITRENLESWRVFAPYLDELRAALGPDLVEPALG